MVSTETFHKRFLKHISETYLREPRHYQFHQSQILYGIICHLINCKAVSKTGKLQLQRNNDKTEIRKQLLIFRETIESTRANPKAKQYAA